MTEQVARTAKNTVQKHGMYREQRSLEDGAVALNANRKLKVRITCGVGAMISGGAIISGAERMIATGSQMAVGMLHVCQAWSDQHKLPPNVLMRHIAEESVGGIKMQVVAPKLQDMMPEVQLRKSLTTVAEKREDTAIAWRWVMNLTGMP